VSSNIFKPADIMLVYTGSSYGALVLMTLNLLQKDEVKFSHVILILDDKKGIEALSSVKYTDLEERIKGVKSYKIIRNNKLTDAQRVAITKKAEKLFGFRYGVFRIVLQLLDQLFKTNYFTKLVKDRKNQICSTLVSWAYHVVAGVEFNGVPWQSVEPDDIDDESIRNTEDWDVVDASIDMWRL